MEGVAFSGAKLHFGNSHRVSVTSSAWI